LRVEDLKLEHGVIEVRRAVWNGIEGNTKTKSGRRNVFIDSATIQLLRDFLAGRQTGRLFQSRVGTPLETEIFAEGFFLRSAKKSTSNPVGCTPSDMVE